MINIKASDYGAWIAEIRTQSGFPSQRQLAAATGISVGTICQIEQGHIPKPITLKKLAKHLPATTYVEMLVNAYGNKEGT